ncbi:MAG: DMT family transporter [Pseudomonadota bacterium]
MKLSSAAVGHVAMLAFSALVALSFSFGSLVASDIAPSVLTLMRFVIAAATLLGIAWCLNMRLHVFAHRAWHWLVIGGLMSTYFITMFVSLTLTTALATSAVFTLTPLMAAGIGWMLNKQRADMMTTVALVIGAVGALWVIFRADLQKFLSFEIGAGEAIFFVGAVAHAAVPAVTNKLAPSVKSFDAALGTVLGALVVTGIYCLPEAFSTSFTTLPAAVWWVAAYLGVVTTAGTFFLLQVAIQRLSPGKVMAYTYLVHSWVILHGLLFGAYESALIYIGVAMTLVALVLLLSNDLRGSALAHQAR